MFNLNDKEINELFCKAELYNDIFVDVDDDTSFVKLANLICEEIRLDCYCTECKKERTFISVKTTNPLLGKYNNAIRCFTGRPSNRSMIRYLQYFSRSFTCSMNDSHDLIFYFRLNKNTIQKIGQYPSLADLEQNDIKKYDKVLSKANLSDLSKAIGLHAHGVGAGSFVYLRRIFEDLIEEAYKESVSAMTLSESINFNGIKMKEKIDNLNVYLPSFIYSNPVLYDFLSGGIHSLDEEYCKDNFEKLKEAIFVILDQDIRKKEDMDREQRLSVLNLE